LAALIGKACPSWRVWRATALAQEGATAHEIAAVTGHQSLEEIERYTRVAERKRLADQAIKKFKA